jgi:DNA-binding MarR family transcriptional regulator
MQIELLKREPDCPLTEVQSQTFRLLLELAEEGKTYTAKEIAARINLPSPLAYWSRLKRLEAKGLIRIMDDAAAKLPTSVLSKA